ncbi:MAG: hypothetical protein L3J88_04560 [Gammaproteobacteria bacterium]|nr:hypothetical protein [Gammaproteobacteria bacterium]
MRIRVEPELHNNFLATCRQKDKPAAQVLREFMREYVSKYPPIEQQELFVAETEAAYKQG